MPSFIRAYMAEADAYSRGVVKDRNRLYWEDFKQMASLCPPRNEQVLIGDFIDEATRTAEDARKRVIHEIALLHEFRTRLISDLVTGKLDVREAAANLLEKPADEPPADAIEEPGDDSEEIASEGESEPLEVTV